MPEASAQATARVSRASLMSRCQVAATMPRVRPWASMGCCWGAPEPLMASPLRCWIAGTTVQCARGGTTDLSYGLFVGAPGRVRRGGAGPAHVRLDDLQQVPHPVTLGAQVAHVVGGDVGGQAD